MKEKLLKHYQGLKPRRFVMATVVVLIILDLLRGYYLKLSWVTNNLAGKTLHMWSSSLKLQTGELSPDTLAEISALVNKSFDFFLFLIFLNNLFFYFFYLRKKLWAQGYVLFYTFSAALMSVTFIFYLNSLGGGWPAFNLLTIPIYLYLFLGVKMLKNETTLVPEKKGR